MSNISIKSGGGTTSAQIGSSNDQHPGEDSLGDTEALKRAFADERYSRSASYRAYVEECIANSMVTTSTHDQGAVRYQTVTEAQAIERDAQKPTYDDPHSLAMIAKAAKHGL